MTIALGLQVEEQDTSWEYIHAGEIATPSIAAAIPPETSKKVQIRLEKTDPREEDKTQQATPKTEARSNATPESNPCTQIEKEREETCTGAATKHLTGQTEILIECELEDSGLQQQQATL